MRDSMDSLGEYRSYDLRASIAAGDQGVGTPKIRALRVELPLPGGSV